MFLIILYFSISPLHVLGGACPTYENMIVVTLNEELILNQWKNWVNYSLMLSI